MLDDTTLATLFRDARTHTAWRAQEVTDAQLRTLYELCKWGPTSANSSPLRITFVRSPAAKERLLACMAPGNLEKTRTAPVTAILGMDLEFYEKLPQLFPQVDARAWFVGNAELAETTAMRNSSLQAGYFILAARAIGLDCGPMSGFDAARLDAEFFAGTTIRTNFVCNLGYGDTSALHPRLPRLSFEEACTVL